MLCLGEHTPVYTGGRDIKAQFYTSCVGVSKNEVDHLIDMAENAIPITWRTFIRHVDVADVRESFPYYSYRGELYNPDTGELTSGFHIKDDWAVGFYRGKFNGRRAYYIRHSAIEYIWLY